MSQSPPPQQPQDPTQGPPPRVAPPQQAGGTPIMAPPPQQPQQVQGHSAWPVVIGVISIVWGGLGLLCTPVNLANWYFNPALKELRASMPPGWSSYFLFSLVTGVITSVLLLAAGIQTVRRRPAGRGLHLAYAWLAIVLSVVGTIYTVHCMARGMENMPSEMRGSFIGGMIGGLIGLAYPVFLLVWFYRRRIRDEVDGWRRQRMQRQTFGPPGGPG